MAISRSSRRIAGAIAAIALTGLALYRGCAPGFVHGNMLDTTLVADAEGHETLWIVTDDSWHYSVKSGNTTGSGTTHCFSCKVRRYVYDPVRRTVLLQTQTPLDGPPLAANVFQDKDHVWVVVPKYHQEPRVEEYDANTGALLEDTAKFIARSPLLRAGLVDARYDANKHTIELSTKDGRSGILYSLADDKLYASANQLPADAAPLACVLRPEGGESRMVLKMQSRDKYRGVQEEPVSSAVYLDGIIYYQDPEVAAIVHVDQIGKRANRMLTLVDLKAKRELWTAKQDELFNAMKIDEDSDTFSSLFFTKDDIKVKRGGGQLMLQLRNKGAMGFELATGKKLWEVSI